MASLVRALRTFPDSALYAAVLKAAVLPDTIPPALQATRTGTGNTLGARAPR